MSKPIEDLRRDYRHDSLSLAELPKSPLALFTSWFEDACKIEEIAEPNAMVVSTVSALGSPSARVVLLKSFDARGFVFYTNYTSQKGQELDANPAVALTFWWDRLERQVRVEGYAERCAPAESDAYFNMRPRGSQLGAWTSPQSQVIEDRQLLHDNYTRHEQTYADGDVPRPPYWGGFRIVPTRLEFWQGRSNRLHDRFMYSVDAKKMWNVVRLAP